MSSKHLNLSSMRYPIILLLSLFGIQASLQAQRAEFQALRASQEAYFEAFFTHLGTLPDSDLSAIAQFSAEKRWDEGAAYVMGLPSYRNALAGLADDFSKNLLALATIKPEQEIKDSLIFFAGNFFDKHPIRLWDGPSVAQAETETTAEWLKCYDRYEADFQFATVGLLACELASLESATAGCLAGYGLATYQANVDFERCLEDTYGTSGN